MGSGSTDAYNHFPKIAIFLYDFCLWSNVQSAKNLWCLICFYMYIVSLIDQANSDKTWLVWTH